MRRALAPLVIAVLIGLAYWPGLHGFWTRDDFMQLAFARLVGSPWPIFVGDHYFPVPGSVFRPLGFASFWLWQALFGTDYFAHATGDLVLHVAVGLALYRVIRFAAVDRVPALLCTLVFALHPAVIGTALWWSARFDLLALLFSLVAVRAALDYTERARVVTLLVALFAMLAALLSKETALAAAAATGLVWLRAASIDRTRRAAMLRAFALLVGVVVAFFAWRAAVLGTVTTGIAGDASLVAALGRGIGAWLSNVVVYVLFWPRSGVAAHVALLVGAVCGIGAVVFGFGVRKNANSSSSSGIDLMLCGLCFFVLPAVLQAPIAAMNAAPLRADASAIEATMQSRLYYFSIGGLAIALAAAIGCVRSDARIARVLLTIALVVPMAAFGWLSHDAAAAFAQRTQASRPMAEAAAAAVDRAAATSGARCRIVVLGVVPPPVWSVFVSIDSVAKALSTDLDRTGRCFVEADYPTYFNLLRGDANAAAAAPYTAHVVDGRPIDWLRLGDMTAAYLDPPPTIDAASLDGIVFLRYENGAFVDATRDVAAGRIAVTLR